MRIASVLFFTGCLLLQGLSPAAQQPLPIGDPTIFAHQGIYYLYGTGPAANDGIMVYRSRDAVQWEGPVGASGGFALKKGDAFGDKGFWAPQVFACNDSFYMAYTANEQIAIAVSNSPLGPFRQTEPRPLAGAGKKIDPFVFRDDDGTWYLYHVRLQKGNRLFVAKMYPDLHNIDTGTVKELLSAELPWENTQHTGWPVAEGPTVLKKNGRYWLLYSANDFRNPDYAVGYATAASPWGPFIKQQGGPLISRHNTAWNGTGHGDLLQLAGGRYCYVFHTHFNKDTVAPRLGAIVDVQIGRKGIRIKPNTAQLLQLKKAG
ncbi:MAG: glycoside hydrolase family 43 protein [Flavihumibacter sp.]